MENNFIGGGHHSIQKCIKGSIALGRLRNTAINNTNKLPDGKLIPGELIVIVL